MFVDRFRYKRTTLPRRGMKERGRLKMNDKSIIDKEKGAIAVNYDMSIQSTGK